MEGGYADHVIWLVLVVISNTGCYLLVAVQAENPARSVHLDISGMVFSLECMQLAPSHARDNNWICVEQLSADPRHCIATFERRRKEGMKGGRKE